MGGRAKYDHMRVSEESAEKVDAWERELYICEMLMIYDRPMILSLASDTECEQILSFNEGVKERTKESTLKEIPKD